MSLSDGDVSCDWVIVTWSRSGKALDHIVPTGDYRPHEIDGETHDCWCKPSIDDDVHGQVIHRAMDGREAFESGERLVS